VHDGNGGAGSESARQMVELQAELAKKTQQTNKSLQIHFSAAICNVFLK